MYKCPAENILKMARVMVGPGHPAPGTLLVMEVSNNIPIDPAVMGDPFLMLLAGVAAAGATPNIFLVMATWNGNMWNETKRSSFTVNNFSRGNAVQVLHNFEILYYTVLCCRIF